jgi:hypothetical protein
MTHHPSRLVFVCLVAFALAPAGPRAVSPDVVISQVYGGGGNSGAPYTNDFIELFNRGTAPVNLSGWSVQYTSATGTGNFSSNVTALTGTIAPGQYFLVRQSGGSVGAPLPTADASGGINMSATAGKVIVANTTAGVVCNGGSSPCSAAQLASIVDLAGYGGANFFEGGAAAPALNNTTAAQRQESGCTDTDHNGADFSAAAPAPRNTATALTPCDGPPVLTIDDVSVVEGNSGLTSATFTVRLSAPAPPGGVTFDIATADNTATSASGDYVALALSAETITEGNQSYAFTVTVNGDTQVESHEAFFVNITGVTGAVSGDLQGVGTVQNDDVAPPSFDVVISQVYGGGGNSGAIYRNDFIELYNRGATTVTLDGWSVQYNSASGTGTWQVTALAGSIAPGAYHLVQQAQGAGGTTTLPSPDTSGAIAMSGTTGKVALRSATTPLSGACPSGAAVIDLVGYGNTACFEGLTGPTLPLTNTTAALRKRGGCLDSNDNAADFLIGSPTPRNSAFPARSCEYLTRAIHEIQGDGLQTPLWGQDVTTTGIVTGRKSNGFFMQAADADADANPATSEAIFVFTSSAPSAAVGDAVGVKGTATEFFSLTQIESTLPGDVTVGSSGHVLPAPVTLTTAMLSASGSATQLERVEGMRVQANALVSVAPTNGFGEIEAVLGGVNRPMREPGIGISSAVPPDPGTGVADCCIPRWDENPERIVIDSDGLEGSSPVWVTSNVTFTNVSGPLDFSFSRYKVLPEHLAPGTANMSAAPVPPAAPNEFTIAGYNIETFNLSETTQLSKAALAIRAVMRDPDIIGAIEVADLASLEALALRINGDALAAGDASPAYEARLVPAAAGGTQNVGFLVKTSRVRIDEVTQERAGDTFVNPHTGQTETLHDRPPLVLRASVDPGDPRGGPVIVVVNHLRSFIDIEIVEGEGVRVREKRKAQAEAVAHLLQELQAANPATPVISVGDYNAFQFSDGYTDPIATLKGAPTPGDQIVVGVSPDLVDPNYVNLIDALPTDQRYTFIFEGTPQALDHVLVNAAAHRLFQRIAVARTNADFPRHASGGFSADPARPEANSDHDMPVAYFAVPGSPVVTLNGAADVTVEAYTSYADPGATAHDDRGALDVTVSGSVNVSVPGDYILSYTATNGFQTTTVTRTVHVVDSTPPSIAGLTTTPASLGPPNHKMVDVALLYSATDASGAAACRVAVSSNEPTNARGDGNTAVDWAIVSSTHVQLRAERSGRGTSRIYTLTVTCADAAGNASAASASVVVSK